MLKTRLFRLVIVEIIIIGMVVTTSKFEQALSANKIDIDKQQLEPSAFREDIGSNVKLLKSGEVINSKAQESKLKSKSVGLEQSMFSQKRNVLPKDASCNPAILKALGVPEPEITKPQLADVDTLAFCRRNRFTCCSASDISSLTTRFEDNAKTFLRAFQPVEEVLTFFKGPAYKDNIKRLKKKDECKAIVKDLKDSSGNPIDFFSDNFINRKLGEINSLLNEVETFLKRELWFHSNLVCAACNPNENRYFELGEQKSRLRALMNTCSDILEGFEYEMRLAQVYNSFVRYVLELVNCNSDLPESKRVTVPAIDPAIITTMENQFSGCLANFKENDGSCLSICSKQISRYVSKVELFNPYRVSAQILYGFFVSDETIDDYYMSRYNKSFPESTAEDVKFFDDGNADWTKYNLSAIEWDFDVEGVNIYNDHMSKRFIRVSTAVVY